MIEAVLVFLAGYLAGSLPTASVAARLAGMDIKKVGDRNAGAANVWRHVGPEAGLIVGLVDMAKGAVPVAAVQAMTSQDLALLCGLAVVAGHNWSVFMGFRGGRGSASTIGIMLALQPLAMGILLAAAGIAFFVTRSSIVSGAVLFAPLWLLSWVLGGSLALIFYSIALPALVGATHFITTRNLPDDARKEASRFV